MKGIEDIVKKHFSRSLLGYDIREVDLFLDEIIAEMERLEGERRELMSAMDSLLDELEEYDALQAEAIRVKNGILPQPKKEIPAPDGESAAEVETAEESLICEEKVSEPAEQQIDASPDLDDTVIGFEESTACDAETPEQAPAGAEEEIAPDAVTFQKPEDGEDKPVGDEPLPAETEDRPNDPASDVDAEAAPDPENGTESPAAETEN